MDEVPTYVVFEGGGAVGVCHVGVLRALQQKEDIKIKGYAGTSAGALVATLAAMGIPGDKMIDKTNGRFVSVLNLLDDDVFRSAPYHLEPFKSAKDLIGPGRGWFYITVLRYFASKADGLKATLWKGLASLLAVLALVAAFLAPGLLAFMMFDWLPWYYRLAISIGIALLPFADVVFLISRFRGIARLERAERALYALIHDRIRQKSEAGTLDASVPNYRAPITFEFFERVFDCKLKIVATDLDAKQLTLFSKLTTPKACVVKATIASIAIPIAFHPQRVALDADDPDSERVFADGGLVSNLPTWSFEPEIKKYPNARIVTSELKSSTQEASADRSFGAMMIGVARSAVFGSAALGELRIPANVVRIFPSHDDLDMLDIDASADLVTLAARKAQVTADAVLRESARLDNFLGLARTTCETAFLGSTNFSAIPPEMDFQAAIAREDRLNETPTGRFSLRHFSNYSQVHRTRRNHPLQEAAAAECARTGKIVAHVFRSTKVSSEVLDRRHGFVRFPLDAKPELFQREPPGTTWIAAVEIDVATTDEDVLAVPDQGFKNGIDLATGRIPLEEVPNWQGYPMPSKMQGIRRRRSVLVLQGNFLFGNGKSIEETEEALKLLCGELLEEAEAFRIQQLTQAQDQIGLINRIHSN